MKKVSYTRISYKERMQIEHYLRIRMTVSEVAKELNRPKSTISREIKRGQSFPGISYLADNAQFYSRVSSRIRRIDTKLSLNNRLRFYVLKGLFIGWSPEQIDNRLKDDYPLDVSMRISYESIYKYIYCETKGKMQRKLIALLPYNKPKRTGKSKREIYMGSIIEIGRAHV